MHEKFYPVILSILTTCLQHHVWKLIDQMKARELYEFICTYKKLRVHPCIQMQYSANLEKAAETIIGKCKKNSIGIIDYWSDEYPHILRQISRPPIILFTMGKLINTCRIAIVGSRVSDMRSNQVGHRLASELSSCGYCIVSGMAMGIDREAHLGGLEGQGGTIGVLANGIDIMYPQINADLFSKILKSPLSALISEYPPGIIAGKWTFVQRNRIISGLSLGTVVVKAAKKSGALITAGYAVEQNREVFACPGHTFSEEYEGCHGLIRNGAMLVSSTDDILEELNSMNVIWRSRKMTAPAIPREQRIKDIVKEKEARHDENSTEGRILGILREGEIMIDDIVRMTGFSAGDVQKAVVQLELEGLLFRNGNSLFRI